jgi:predicted unusual protein kinase regulating ubiquinone biosynthesis (AarF/ABC1/UbiB family)
MYFDFLKKTKRFGQQISTFSTVAKGVLPTNVSEKDMDTLGRELYQKLGNLKGVYMKVAQFLATVPGTLPDSVAHYLLSLQSHAPPMGGNFVKRRMEMELGENWEKRFSFFDYTPRFAASLGQIHYAITKNGKEVACKLQYPNMKKMIQQDFSSIDFLTKIYQRFFLSINPENILEEMRERLEEELDYKNEAYNLVFFKKIFDHISFVKIPDVIDDFGTSKLLVMEWINGQSPLSVKSLSNKNEWVKKLFYSWYYPFYAHNVLHGDPHPGNYIFSTQHGEEKVNLVDFGCVKHFTPEVVDGTLSLYFGLLHHNNDWIIQGYERIGFTNLNTALITVLNEWAQLLYGPILDHSIRPMQKNHSGENAVYLAKKIHQKLHALGGVNPPKAFVMLDRAAVGIGAICMHLEISTNWFLLFGQCLRDANKINKRIGKWVDAISF